MYDIYNNDPENCTNCSDIYIITTQNQFSQVEEAGLPLMHDPAIKLYPNKTKALKVYNQPLEQLIKLPPDKEQIIQSKKNTKPWAC